MALSTLGRLVVAAALLLLANPAQAQYNPAQTIPVNFFDISAIGTPATAAESDDGLTAAITFATAAPGFSFTYFGVAATGFQVGANGYMTINTSGGTSS